MKNTHLLLAGGTLALGLIGSTTAATLVGDFGAINPVVGVGGVLLGADADGKSRIVKRTNDDPGTGALSDRIVVGQTFTLASATNVDAIYLKANSAAVWDGTAIDAFQIKIFDSSSDLGSDSAAATLTIQATTLSTLANTWLKFSFDPVTLAASGVGENAAFAMYFTGEKTDNWLSLNRSNHKADGGAEDPYADGTQIYTNGYVSTDWDGVTPISGVGDENNDLAFFVGGSVVPEPSSTALLGLAGFAFMIRRRR